MTRIITFLAGLLPILNPLVNETRGQKAGTWVSILAAVIGAIVLALQVFGGATVPDTPDAPENARDTIMVTDTRPDGPDAHDGESDGTYFTEVDE
jgi:hypothetical protein